MTIRLALADDHPLILGGLEDLFSLEEDFQVVGRCTDGLKTLAMVRAHLPDILILDIRMPGKSGLETAREMQKEDLPTRVVLLTAALDEDQMLAALQAGVQGIVLKEMAPQLLVQCIRKVHAGEQWLERGSTRMALGKMLRREAGAREMSLLLTAREIEILSLIARGLKNREIAEKISISEGTVKVHLHNICEKLNINGRLALSLYAQQKGLV